jgi:hypothetical protein
MKKLIYPLLAILSLSSCDCWQCAEGRITEAGTFNTLDSVKVTSYTKGVLTQEMYTDSSGYYEVCTSNTGRCDDYLKVSFEKKGYKTQEYLDPSNKLNIILEK